MWRSAINTQDVIRRLNRLARNEGIGIQDLQSRYAAERLFARIQLSSYHQSLILKGGYLIGALIGIETRPTRDLDYATQQISDERILTQIITKVASIDANDGTYFDNIKIRLNPKSVHHYNPGYKINMNLKMANPDPSRPDKPITFKLKIDLTIDDIIIPKIQRFNHISEIDGSQVSVYAYPVEQILAEKISACLAHGDQDTRTRDFFDIYALAQFKGHQLDNVALKESILTQLTVHQQNEAIMNPISAFQDLGNSNRLIERWNNDAPLLFTSNLEFETVIHAITGLLQQVGFDKDAPSATHHPWLTEK